MVNLWGVLKLSFIAPFPLSIAKRKLENTSIGSKTPSACAQFPTKQGVKSPFMLRLVTSVKLLLLDLKKAFFHVDVPKAYRHLVGIAVRGEPLRFRKLPMGFLNSPIIFQYNLTQGVTLPVRNAYREFMKKQGREDEERSNPISGYIDDIVIATKNVADHLILLDILFKQLAEMKLTLSINKCFIGKKRINLLGSSITGEGRSVQPERIHALKLWAPPRNVSELRAFLGSIRYIAEYIPELSIALRNFDALTGGVPKERAKLVPIEWTRDLFNDFVKTKEMTSNPKVLAHFVFGLPLYLQTDASEFGFGALIFQTDEGIEPPFEKIYPLAFYTKP